MNDTRIFFQKVFAWMFAGLLISGAIAFATASTPVIYNFVLGNPFILFAVIIAELGLVIALTWLMKKISTVTAIVLFLLYSFLTGLTLATIFITYTLGSISTTFIVAAIMFGIMAVLGFFTKIDLSRFGIILLMGLIGIIIATVINFFLRSAAFDYVISIIGVLVFTGLTAYDVQRIKRFGEGTAGEEEAVVTKAAIMGALHLYLDFINLFLQLLRFFGKRR